MIKFYMLQTSKCCDYCADPGFTDTDGRMCDANENCVSINCQMLYINTRRGYMSTYNNIADLALNIHP